MNNPADVNRDLEQRAVEALEDFKEGMADAEQIRLLAWLTCVDAKLIERVNNGYTKGN